MARKVIVFGASGEIGGRIARLAVDAGHRVYGVTRGQNKRDMVDLAGVEMIHGDKGDPEFMKSLGKRLQYDAVIDSVPNIGTMDLIRKHLPAAENVFFCSSTGTFVPLLYMPADELHPWREETSVNFYPQCLRDGAALDLYAKGGFPITIFRPTNIIGPSRVPLELWGARDINFYRRLKANEPISIPTCENILLQSGYNWDLASAFVLGLDKPDAVRGEIFIISCKRAITLGTYLKTAMDFLGSTSRITSVLPEELMRIYPEVTWKNRLGFLMEHMCFDISKAERVLGYAPKKTAQQGLIDALQWCVDTGLL
ncbi:MAG TPA: NAD-dependent epimerase/dehydratase family protein [Lentisphaeria bacterium]|nr:NAD-dependent epimerase/dehydratase family protein [Lentisphaerota bacterium]OQC15630.1 MAG: NAD dependent epimerase/dehydratase family protein [Lentisphaerae bacterium ADurb.Bin082]HPY89870.1 NAD-dependent epimerase/dehydratase family protein [Lentisphaeria bacterium]HQL86126.1 NAD-dependent epimerase/dehydratase family protein [Lentisphaeria bacterium]